ncbi:MAG: DeoR family transcriptional regulator [Candidatus Dactylopiibacterium carminicum]|uniref:DeoR family transcriptional regulator n=1 Tax=Candidatus Dactylopiibacterium carminicum TaxID=857335 RepID=A0A272ERY5_9RHOO|nr:DeoR/GlpR family DNA-binding transcription regulator [Candidatus Dactylopiibacterium carminicum]KAF7598947.1 DeoR/GlpR transcriptional regulator [Candidatus Dactylopiibacterium carminicum]PAS92871.1 MAG: DeoR family transcriptional regulator [Candidatus Dactylopiibacterium carminicum]PAS96372.1 MAG: DeoR family transcriptional regulator [Candidatus Dactylopiibacterium carminicum]PAS98965.1 MAG: DeoR family transcriptional regulator [Candidatus Dactylopiibacterium carminicum]
MPQPLLDARAREILELVRRDGFVGIDELALRFEVTPQTIRRCVNPLCEHGLLRRVHGGVDLPAPTTNLPYQRRQILHLPAKRSIAAMVAAFIPDGASVSLGIGTTPEQVAVALRRHTRLRVITNSLNAANALAGQPGIELIIAGGTLRTNDLDVVGSAAANCFAAYKTDYAVFGVGGVDHDGTLLDFDTDEVTARLAMMRNCRSALLVADATKFGRGALARGGRLADADHLFTDTLPPAGYLDAIPERRPQLHVAGESAQSPLASCA